MALGVPMPGEDLDQALWNLSIILGRPYQETRDTYNYLEQNRKEYDSNNGLFSLINQLGNAVKIRTDYMDGSILETQFQ